MKFLFLLIFLFLTGCHGLDEEVPTVVDNEQDKLLFKAADVVLIHEPFYSDCFGYVVGYEPKRFSDQPVIYSVALQCTTTGILGKVIKVPEGDLQLRLRKEPNTGE